MGDAIRVSGDTLNLTTATAQRKHKPTVGKIIFWTGVFFAGVAILTQAGLFLPHLAAFSFEFKTLALIAAAVGCIAMVYGHKKIEHGKHEIKKIKDSSEEDLLESSLNPAIQVSNSIESDPYFTPKLPSECKSVRCTLYYDPQEDLWFLVGEVCERCERAYQFPNTIITRKDNKYYMQLAVQLDASNPDALVRPKEYKEELTVDQLLDLFHNALESEAPSS